MKRRGLERKDELRLYEWMKQNYEQLSGKTVTEGAQLVRNELGLDISNSTIMSMTRDMDMQPFWRARQPKEEAESTLEGHAKALMQHREALHKLSEVCNNIVDRLEHLENARNDAELKRIAHLEDMMYQIMMHLAYRHSQGGRQGLIRLMGAHKDFVTAATSGKVNGHSHEPDGESHEHPTTSSVTS